MHLIIKICGLTTRDAVDTAVAAGADAVGFVFAESPRQVSPARARELLAGVPAHVRRVAVFRNPSGAELRAIADLPIDVVQAAPSAAGAVSRALPPHVGFLPSVGDGPELLDDVGRAEACAHGMATRGLVLVDGPQRSPGDGGNGERGDSRRVASVSWRHPVLLAGGLDADNVPDAIAGVRPAGVDVSSGVEAAPGRKDLGSIVRFVTAARAAARCSSESGVRTS